MQGALAVLGTGSDVGKSVIAAGLGRLLADAGLDVAPFKAQNMGNQAGVTADGLEMPRAQILQARACRQEPHVDMGPVLLKPVSATGAEVIVLGRATGIAEAADYFRDTTARAAVAAAALARLAARHQAIVIEGAGSPVEVNLWPRDFANLVPARQVGAAIVLVADIDRGGVFAQVAGTLGLLPPGDRARVLGVLVNRFRGDRALFDDGVARLEALAGAPVLGVVAHLEHGLDEEDRPLAIPLDARAPAGMLRVGALLTPRVANTEDLAPLLAKPDVHLTWITRPELVDDQDALVLAGSKATTADLVHLTASGVAERVRAAAARGAWVLGLCGGYQMLGHELDDTAGTEGGPRAWPGLGLLPVRTAFGAAKVTARRRVASRWPEPGHALEGYEIHHGVSAPVGPDITGEPLTAEGGVEIGWRAGRVAGAYLHGLLASDGWRAAWLDLVRRDLGRAPRGPRAAASLDARLDRWAAHLRASLRPGAWERLLAAATAGAPARASGPR